MLSKHQFSYFINRRIKKDNVKLFNVCARLLILVARKYFKVKSIWPFQFHHSYRTKYYPDCLFMCVHVHVFVCADVHMFVGIHKCVCASVCACGVCVCVCSAFNPCSVDIFD